MTCALLLRAWLQVRLRTQGLDDAWAADLSWLVVPVVLTFLLWPVLWRDRRFLAGIVDLRRLERRTLVEAVAIGALIRIAWWSQLVAGGAFGLYRGDRIPSGPRLAFDCPAPEVLALGIVVMTVAVPLVEEVAFRGYLQTAARRHGAVVAIMTSATAFTLFHPLADALFVTLAGIVLGIQYHRHGTLWPSIITHATINGLAQLDWRCLRGQQGPPGDNMASWGPGVLAAGTCCAAITLVVVLLLRQKDRGAAAPRPRSH